MEVQLRSEAEPRLSKVIHKTASRPLSEARCEHIAAALRNAGVEAPDLEVFEALIPAPADPVLFAAFAIAEGRRRGWRVWYVLDALEGLPEWDSGWTVRLFSEAVLSADAKDWASLRVSGAPDLAAVLAGDPES